MTESIADLLTHHFAGGVYAKETRIPSGMVLVQHKHLYDHLSILASGQVLLEVDGERRILTGPMCLTIEAGKHHGVRAITDAVWFCIHRDVGDEQALIVESDAGVMQAMAEAML